MRRWCARSSRRWPRARPRRSTARCPTSERVDPCASAAATDNIGAVLRRGHLHRHRLDPADQGLPRDQNGIIVEPLRAVALGDPDGDRGVRHPRRAAAAARPAALATTQREAARDDHARPRSTSLGGAALRRVRRPERARPHAIRKRFGNAVFWGLLAVSFLAGDRSRRSRQRRARARPRRCSPALGGLGAGKPADDRAEERQAQADAARQSLFLPALIIPAIGARRHAGRCSTSRSAARRSSIPKQVTLISLALGVVIALAVADGSGCARRCSRRCRKGRRLMDAVGWAAILPQMLASLGAVFALAGVGDVVGELARRMDSPLDNALAAVAAYAIGMALLHDDHGQCLRRLPGDDRGDRPAAARASSSAATRRSSCAIGMLSGFCGTLMTPMAANFNIVPAALLELRRTALTA